MRLVIVLLLLVVLPTAILSLVAGHSIQSREVLLHQRYQQSSLRKIKNIGEELEQMTRSDSELVLNAFRETVLAGKNNDCMVEKIHDLRNKSNFLKDAYLFMNPWNFIFPRYSKPEKADGISEELLLKQELIKQISISLKREASNIAFSYEGAVYCFKPVPDMPELYAGFEIDMEKVVAKLESLLAENSNEDTLFRISSIDGKNNANVRNEFFITDSFNPNPSKGNSFRDDYKTVLVRGRLPKPFMNIEISAYLVDENRINKAEKLESRLIEWGILLLAIVIITSSTIVIRMALNQAVSAKKRSEFVVGMSHDLRTPVAAMRVLADSLSSGRVESPEKQKKFLTSISSECERLSEMIERILFFFKQEHGAVTYCMQPLDIGSMVGRLVESAESRAAGKMRVKLRIENSLPNVDGDLDSLEKVVTNILENALKYGGQDKTERLQNSKDNDTGETGSDYVVSVFKRRLRRRNWVVISVSDSGKGIDVSEQKKIFKRFYRVESDTQSHVGGIGLGLSLCSDIIRAHHGRITVKSVLGKGAEFSVWLRA